MWQRQTFLGVFTYKTAAKINYGIIDMEQYYVIVTLCIDNQPELGLLSWASLTPLLLLLLLLVVVMVRVWRQTGMMTTRRWWRPYLDRRLRLCVFSWRPTSNRRWPSRDQSLIFVARSLARGGRGAAHPVGWTSAGVIRARAAAAAATAPYIIVLPSRRASPTADDAPLHSTPH